MRERIREGISPAMEQLPIDSQYLREDPIGRRIAIDDIAKHRESCIGEMDSDLMHPSGMDLHFEQGKLTKLRMDE